MNKITNRPSIFNWLRQCMKFKPFETIIAFLSQNKNLDSWIGKLIPENHFYKKNSIRRVKRNNINYSLDISDYQHWLVYFGLKEDAPKGLFNLVKGSKIIFDVGSNIGQTAMTMAINAEKESTIYGFEPDLTNFSYALENLKLNNFNNINYFNVGLGAVIGSLSLKVNSPLNFGGNRIDKKSKDLSSMVKIETLDNMVEKLKLERVDLVKIDVEGFELEVLKGAANTLTLYKPKLFIEIDEANLLEQNTTPAEVVNLIKQYGYEIFNSRNRETMDSNYNFKGLHTDIICY